MQKAQTLRISQDNFQQLGNLFREAEGKETQAFALCSKTVGPNECIHQVKELILPEEGDFEKQSAAGVRPTVQYQYLAYSLAMELELSIFDFHNHPFADEVHLSSTDFYHGEKDGRFVADKFPDKTDRGMIVFGQDMSSFDGRLWDRKNKTFVPITRLSALGSPITILPADDYEDNDLYARHRIIPGWKQGTLESLRVCVIGNGGNGALILEGLLALGVGKRGWIKTCDPDILEASNIPRIPYACLDDVGKPKSEISQAYAARKAPDSNVFCYQEKINSEAMLAIAKEADVLIGAVDNHGARKILNSLSARYRISYIDLGSEIIPNEFSYESGGQVRIVLPGKNGCMMCTGEIDPSTAALDSLSEQDWAERGQAGYVRGTDFTPTPSVLHLNGVVSSLAISQFLRLVFGDEKLRKSAFLHYDQQSYQLLSASVDKNPDCPVCGDDGYLAEGDEITSNLPDLPAKGQSQMFRVIPKQEFEEKTDKKTEGGHVR